MNFQLCSTGHSQSPTPLTHTLFESQLTMKKPQIKIGRLQDWKSFYFKILGIDQKEVRTWTTFCSPQYGHLILQYSLITSKLQFTLALSIHLVYTHVQGCTHNLIHCILGMEHFLTKLSIQACFESTFLKSAYSPINGADKWKKDQ